MLTAFIQRAVVQGIPLLFGSTGGSSPKNPAT